MRTKRFKGKIAFFSMAAVLAFLLPAAGFDALRAASADGAEPVGITTAFTRNTGAWANHEPSQGDVEIATDPTEGGCLKVTVKNSNPGLRLDFPQAVSADEYTVMAVKMKVNSEAENLFELPSSPYAGSARAEVYWVRQGDPGFEASRFLYPAISHGDAEFKTYIWDFKAAGDHYPGSSPAGWSGSVRQVRFDPLWFRGSGGSGTIFIDYIKFYGTVAEAEAARDGEWEDDAVPGKGSEVLLDFKNEKGLAVVNAGEGTGLSGDRKTYSLYVTGTATRLEYAWAAGVDIFTYKWIGIRLKNGAGADAIVLEYTTRNDSEYGADKKASQAMRASDGSEFERYLFDMRGDARFKNVLMTLRFGFTGGTGPIDIDYIKFYADSAEYYADGDDWTPTQEELPDAPLFMFNFAGSAQGWEAGAGCVPSVQGGNALRVTVGSAARPVIEYAFPESLDTKTYPVFRIRMQNRTAGTRMRVSFSDAADFTNLRELPEAAITARDTQYMIYHINPAESGWSGQNIGSLRIELANAGGDAAGNYVQVDHIRFYRSLREMAEDTSAQSSPTARPYAASELKFGLLNGGWANGSSDAATLANTERGGLVMNIKRDSAYIAFEYKLGDASDWQVGLSTHNNRYAAILMKAETYAEFGELRFRRYDESLYPDSRAVKFEIAPGERRVYVLDMVKHCYWTGSIGGFQFYPAADEGGPGDRFTVDYIKFYERIEDIDYEYDPYPPAGSDGKTVFDFTGGRNEGLQNARGTHSYATPTEEGLKISINNGDPVYVYQYYMDADGLDADKYKAMKVTMRNETASEMFEVFFESFYDNRLFSWGSSQNALTQRMTPFDEEFMDYYIDLTPQGNWRGRITQLRFDPAWFSGSDGQGKVILKTIQFYEDIEAATGVPDADIPDLGLDFKTAPGGPNKVLLISGSAIGGAGVVSAVLTAVFMFGKKGGKAV
ncbi:MAG: hypothetical protein LBL66_06730 [Clostridiales bacterium]|jgi:hypothetical protein|nr:hypothetical protein [Clostridiales bacterium]